MSKQIIIIVCLLFTGVNAQTQTISGLNKEALETKILQGLKAYSVPGLSLVVVKDSTIIYSKGFGKTASLFGTTVSDSSLFSVASLSKPVSAYVALKYLNEKNISADESIDHPAKLTYRQLLTHTAGFSNFLRDNKRKQAFTPGSEYSYSGVGYMVLQEHLSQQTSLSLDQLAKRYLFSPAGMHDSFFGESPLEKTVVPGHVPFQRAVMPFLIPFIPVFIVLFLLIFFIPRLAKRKISSAIAAYIAIGAALLAALAFLQSKAGSWNIALLFTGIGFGFFLFFIITLWLLRKLFRQFGFLKTGGLMVISGIVLLAVLFLTLRNFPLPMSTPVEKNGNAAASLRTNAVDMGRFVLHLLTEKKKGSEVYNQMTTAYIKADDENDWGSGFGLRKLDGQTYAWHWGSNPGNRAIIVIDTHRNFGFAILCNSGQGKELLEEVTGFLLNSKTGWKI